MKEQTSSSPDPDYSPICIRCGNDGHVGTTCPNLTGKSCSHDNAYHIVYLLGLEVGGACEDCGEIIFNGR